MFLQVTEKNGQRGETLANKMLSYLGAMFQSTIAKEALAEGVGLHTGVFGHVRLLAAPADTGIVFRRTDLDHFPIEAQGHNVARVSYATSLMKQGVLLSTTEHLLAAIYSCGIDNVYIDIDSIEIPILDGSAEPFIQMLEKAGVQTAAQAPLFEGAQVAGGRGRRPADWDLSRRRIPRAMLC